MTDEALLQLVAEELKCPQFGVTIQFLAIHQVPYFNGLPLLKSIVTTPNGGQRAYLAVEGQQFYLSMYVSPNKAQIAEVDTEPYHDVWLRVTSEMLEPEMLAAFTTLSSSRQWRKRDWSGAVRNAPFNGLDFRCDLNPDLFEHIIKQFLDYLEQDAEGIRDLASNAECIISVASYFHNGNTMLGGHYLDAATLRRISSLNLALDFDLYAKGNSWREANE